jgi:hypothetical protein
MENEHLKKGNKSYTRSPTLIYMPSYIRKQGGINHHRELPLISK